MTQKLFTKLVAFRSQIEVVKKDATNPHFKSKYADLPSLLEAIKPALTATGLSISHQAVYEWDILVMRTTLADSESGESIDSVFPLFGSKAQEVGSSMTYARRYNIQSLLDLSTDDDDGNSANSSAPIMKAKYEDNENPWISDKDLANMEVELQNGEVISKSALKQDYKISKANQEKIVALIAKYPWSFTA